MVTRASISGLGLVLLVACSGATIDEPSPTVNPGPDHPAATPGSGGGTGGGAAGNPTPSPTATGNALGAVPTARGIATAASKALAVSTTPSMPSNEPTPSNEPAPTPTPSVPSAGASYPGHGFVVHEWGTNTVVSASDGTLELGLHHEEEDLPAFVYDRLKAVTPEDRAGGTPNAEVKMETPVLYFYSESPLTVHASVSFPSGVLTQWYPGVAAFSPPILWENIDNPPEDPAMGPLLTTEGCIDHYQKNGMLDWGAFELMADTPAPEALPTAPLDEFTWGHARNVASRALRFPDGETEQFLFYRGLSTVELPATTRASGNGHLSIENTSSAALGSLFVLDVREGSGAFVEHAGGVAPGATFEFDAPAEGAQEPLEAFTAALAVSVTSALDQTGLYHDEAVAMVNTWSRQWFRTPGLRVFYLAPESWTDGVLPLTLDPVPESLVRVMMVRVELLTPELEALDASAADQFASDAGAASAYFDALGRFAEPRLRRALDRVPSDAGKAYLAGLAPEFKRSGGLGE